MRTAEGKRCPCGSSTAIVDRDAGCKVYRHADETGDIVMTSYRVFPGITLTYNDVHMQACAAENSKRDTVFEINHCREGRIEYECRDAFCYLTPGDLSVGCKAGMGQGAYFPLRHYYGITIAVDVAVAPKCLSCFLDDVNVHPANLIQKFCAGGRNFIARSNSSIEHIFSELYFVPDAIKKGYFKVKILELFLFLSALDIAHNEAGAHSVSKTQVTLAKNVCKYLSEHMDSRITLEMLSEVFHVSGTSIKNSFRSVYGVSVYSYIRSQKMQKAAFQLKQTDMAVLEIAGQLGYDNGSKFAKAFRDCYGISPRDYRKIALSGVSAERTG